MEKIKKDKTKIPYGYYCYDEKGVCPYWKKVSGEKYETGFCKYLGHGDWHINETRQLQQQMINKKTGKYKVVREGTAHEIGIMASLLWDQVKECYINIKKTRRKK